MGRTYKYTHNTKEENETKEKESERERICIKQVESWWYDEWTYESETRKENTSKHKPIHFLFSQKSGTVNGISFSFIHRAARGAFGRWCMNFQYFFNKTSANVIGRSLKIAQITFFAFVPTSRRGWSENIVVLDQHGDDRVWNVGGYAVHIASLPPLATIVQYLCHFKLPLCYDFIKQKNKSRQEKTSI